MDPSYYLSLAIALLTIGLGAALEAPKNNLKILTAVNVAAALALGTGSFFLMLACGLYI